MSWMDLYLLLQSMKDSNHSCLVDTPSTRVTCLIDNEEWYLDITESLTSGKIVFIPAVLETSDGSA